MNRVGLGLSGFQLVADLDHSLLALDLAHGDLPDFLGVFHMRA